MIIYDFNLYRPRRAFRPLEAKPLSVIDPDAVLPLAVAPECFQPIAGQVQVYKRRGRLQLVELHLRFALKSGEGFHSISLGELARSLVSEAHNHFFKI